MISKPQLSSRVLIFRVLIQPFRLFNALNFFDLAFNFFLMMSFTMHISVPSVVKVKQDPLGMHACNLLCDFLAIWHACHDSYNKLEAAAVVRNIQWVRSLRFCRACTFQQVPLFQLPNGSEKFECSLYFLWEQFSVWCPDPLGSIHYHICVILYSLTNIFQMNLVLRTRMLLAAYKKAYDGCGG